MAISAEDRFNARVESIMEAERIHGKQSPGAIGSARARAINQIVREDPKLHRAYVDEFNAAQRAKRFRA